MNLTTSWFNHNYDKIDLELYYISAFASFWFLVYSLIHWVFNHKSGMWRSCISGLIHASMVIVSGIIIFSNKNWIIFDNIDESDEPDISMIKMCIMSMTFFSLDTLLMIFYNIELIVTLPHHISSAYALYYTLTTHIYINQVLFLLFIMEVSNPLMCLNAILKLDNKTDTWLFSIVERLYEFVFIVMRVFVGGWFTYTIFTISIIFRSQQ